MSQKEKLLRRLLSKPKDFTFEDLITLFGYFDYYIKNPGKTGGSRITFVNIHDKGDYIRLHKPHPGNVLKPYQVESVVMDLKERRLL